MRKAEGGRRKAEGGRRIAALREIPSPVIVTSSSLSRAYIGRAAGQGLFHRTTHVKGRQHGKAGACRLSRVSQRNELHAGDGGGQRERAARSRRPARGGRSQAQGQSGVPRAAE